MNVKAVLAAVLGAALFAWVLWHVPLGAVLDSIAALGVGGFILVVVWQIGLEALVGWAWALLGWGRADAKPRRFIWARLVREAATQVLPFTHAGGIALGGRALALEGVAGEFAVASTLSDMTVEMTSQLAYLALGAVLLELLRPDNALAGPVLAVILALALMTVALVVARRRGVPFAARLVARATRGRTDSLAARLARGERAQGTARGGPLVLAWVAHFLGWILTGAQTWITLRLLNVDVTFGAALAIDSLTSGARAVAFVIPAGLGVQEGALVLLGQLFGIASPVALALALIRRGRDIAFAGPVIGLWQARHGARIWWLGRAKE